MGMQIEARSCVGKSVLVGRPVARLVEMSWIVWQVRRLGMGPGRSSRSVSDGGWPFVEEEPRPLEEKWWWESDVLTLGEGRFGMGYA